MLPNFLDLLAFRLYLDDNIKDLETILNIDVSKIYGLVILCGRPVKRYMVSKDFNIVLKKSYKLKKGWNILYLGPGKKGYNLTWSTLFDIVKKHMEIEYFILSDADMQIPLAEVKNMEINKYTKVILPQRKKREFGMFTFERNFIEDIENAFIRISTGGCSIPDFQTGLFVIQKDIVIDIDFFPMDKYKWIGDLYFIEQLLKKRFDIEQMDVKVSGDHFNSTIFDYSGPLSEILMGIPILKMKELVDYTGISLKQVKSIMLKDPKVFMPTFFKYANNERFNIKMSHEIEDYLDFIVNLYLKTSEVYKIRI